MELNPTGYIILLFSRDQEEKKKKQLRICSSPADRPLANQRIMKYSDAIKGLSVPTPSSTDSPSSSEVVIAHESQGTANSKLEMRTASL